MPDERPNIIVITTDQQRTDSLSCYGSSFTYTPNIDRLAAEGVLFERAYCSNPVCTPSRVSIFTGQSVSTHGAWNVGMNASDDTVMISHRLAAQGYRTHYIGKTHFQAFSGTAEQSLERCWEWEERYKEFKGPYYGFETVEIALGHATYGTAGHYGLWLKERVTDAEYDALRSSRLAGELPFGGAAHDWDMPVELHNSTWTAERAIHFLEHGTGDKPFFLALGFQDPHHPHCVPVGQEERVHSEDVPLPSYQPGELDDKPGHFRTAHEGRLDESPYRGEYPVAGQGRGHDYGQISEADARLGRSYYYSMVRLIDRQLGRVLDYLDTSGLANNTIVVFTSDHGELLGDHGLWMKGPFHYEQLIRVPTAIRWPDRIPAGWRCSSVFSLIDIAPTIMEGAGYDVPAPMDGISALPMLENQSSVHRNAAVIECVDDPAKLRLKTIVTKERKLTWYSDSDAGELYDLESDPGEVVNRWNAPEYLEDQHALLSSLMSYQERLEPRLERYCYA